MKETTMKHQKGDVAVLEGHEIHKYPIYISRPLSPGSHELGFIEMKGIGKVFVSVDVDRNGNISNINAKWPDEVKPEILSVTEHDVYTTHEGVIERIGKAKCQNIHAGGNCAGCCTYNWLEVVQFETK